MARRWLSANATRCLQSSLVSEKTRARRLNRCSSTFKPARMQRSRCCGPEGLGGLSAVVRTAESKRNGIGAKCHAKSNVTRAWQCMRLTRACCVGFCNALLASGCAMCKHACCPLSCSAQCLPDAAIFADQRGLEMKVCYIWDTGDSSNAAKQHTECC